MIFYILINPSLYFDTGSAEISFQRSLECSNISKFFPFDVSLLYIFFLKIFISRSICYYAISKKREAFLIVKVFKVNDQLQKINNFNIPLSASNNKKRLTSQKFPINFPSIIRINAC